MYLALDEGVLHLKELDAKFLTTPFYKLRLKKFVSQYDDEILVFKDSITYREIERIVELLRDAACNYGYSLEVDESVSGYILKKQSHIDEKSRAGNDLKNRDERVIPQFQAYKDTLNACMARPLREKQLWDSFYMCSMEKSANFSVPGSGKTASVLGMYAYLRLKGKVDRIVMIGPKNSFGSWIDEFKTCFYGTQQLDYFNIHDKAFNSKAAKERALRYDSGNKNLFLFNYESLPGFANVISEIVGQRTLLVFDEVHKVKSTKGKYAAAAVEIAQHASYVVALTGTPIPNSYSDIYNLLHILYPDDYNSFFGFTPALLKKPTEREIEKINEKIRPFFCRTTKDELGVPKANPDEVIKLEANPKENKLFEILYKKYKGNKFSMLVRMLQLESDANMLLENIDLGEFRYILNDDVEDEHEMDFVDYSDEIIQLIRSVGTSTKMNRCLDEVCSLHCQGKTVIVWCIFKGTMSLLCNCLERKGIKARIISGEVDLDERSQIINSFKDGKLDVLITNPHTLAESVSLHSVCHDAIYFEYSYNLVHLLQSKDRIHRLGLPVGQYTDYKFLAVNYDFDGEGYSLDEEIYNRLKLKEDIMLNAINNNILEIPVSSDQDLDAIFKELF